MPFQKGHKLSKGRKPGSVNEVTKELQSLWVNFVHHNFPQIQGWFDKAVAKDPVEGLKLYIQFSNKVLPNVTQSNVDVTSAGERIQAPTVIVNDNNPKD